MSPAGIRDGRAAAQAAGIQTNVWKKAFLFFHIQNHLIFQTAAILMRTDSRTANFASVLTFMLMCLI